METKRFSPWVDLLAMTGIFFGSVLIASMCVGVVMLASGSMEIKGALLFASYTVQFTLAIVGTLIWLRYRGGGRLRFGMGWSDAPAVLGGVVLVIAAGIVLEPLLNLFPEHYLERLNETIGRGGWAILTTVVAAPVLEEIFFRGLVLEQLSRRWSAPAAVAASSLLFGLVHVPILPQMVNAFVVAIVMGYIYLATRSLIPVIILHAINNGLSYIMLELFGTQATDTREIIGNDAIYWTVYGISAVVLAVSLAIMVRKVRTKTSEITLQTETTDE